jgi:hypothetical protein
LFGISHAAGEETARWAVGGVWLSEWMATMRRSAFVASNLLAEEFPLSRYLSRCGAVAASGNCASVGKSAAIFQHRDAAVSLADGGGLLVQVQVTARRHLISFWCSLPYCRASTKRAVEGSTGGRLHGSAASYPLPSTENHLNHPTTGAPLPTVFLNLKWSNVLRLPTAN